MKTSLSLLSILCLPATVFLPVGIYSAKNEENWTKTVKNFPFTLESNSLTFDYVNNDRIGFKEEDSSNHHWFSTYTNPITLNFKLQKYENGSYRDWTLSEIKNWIDHPGTKKLNEICPQGFSNRDSLAKSIQADNNCSGWSRKFFYNSYLTTVNNGGDLDTRVYNYSINPPYNAASGVAGITTYYSDGMWNASGTRGHSSDYEGCTCYNSSVYKDLRNRLLKSADKWNNWTFSRFFTEQGINTNVTFNHVIFELDPSKINVELYTQKQSNGSTAVKLHIKETSNPWYVWVTSFLCWNGSDPYEGVTYTLNSKQAERNYGALIYRYTPNTSDVDSHIWWEEVDAWCGKGNMKQLKSIDKTLTLVNNINNPLDE